MKSLPLPDGGQIVEYADIEVAQLEDEAIVLALALTTTPERVSAQIYRLSSAKQHRL